MNCICGYVHHHDKESSLMSYDTSGRIEEGTEAFDRIDGTFDVKVRNGFGFEKKEITLYACPKCRTVKMEV